MGDFNFNPIAVDGKGRPIGGYEALMAAERGMTVKEMHAGFARDKEKRRLLGIKAGKERRERDFEKYGEYTDDYGRRDIGIVAWTKKKKELKKEFGFDYSGGGKPTINGIMGMSEKAIVDGGKLKQIKLF